MRDCPFISRALHAELGFTVFNIDHSGRGDVNVNVWTTFCSWDNENIACRESARTLRTVFEDISHRDDDGGKLGNFGQLNRTLLCLQQIGSSHGKLFTTFSRAVFQCMVSQIVSLASLSPVNHKGLHKGWTQPSFYLQVIHFTSYDTISLSFFIAYLHSAGTKHGILHSTRRPSLFCRPAQQPELAATEEKSGEVLKKNAGEWIGRVEISKEEISGGQRSMYGYILTYPRLPRENLKALCSQQVGL